MGLPSFSLVDAMLDETLFKRWFEGDSWRVWFAILRAAFALPMTAEEVALFRSVAERDPPVRQVKELWVIGGRRAGKDSVASALVAFFAAFYDVAGLLRPGERAVAMLIACDTAQATICMDLVKAFFAEIPMLAAMVVRETLLGVELNNGISVEIVTNSYRATRGRTVLVCVLDEVAHYYADDRYKNPDEKVYRAIKPGTITLPQSMMIGISTPYGKRGLLYAKYKKHFGEPGDVLVVQAESLVLNPSLDPAIVAEAYEDDPADAAAEFGGLFRSDVAEFIARDAIEALVVPGRRELPPVAFQKYMLFADPAGGAGGDAYAAAIAHAEKDIAIVDALRMWTPPFSPAHVMEELGALCQSYGVVRVEGDRFGGEFAREPLRRFGQKYRLCERSKSEIYRDVLPILNSGRAELLDHERMINQFCLLERRTARGRSDVIDHPARAHDDLCNAVAGVILMVLKPKPLVEQKPRQPVSLANFWQR